MITSLTHFCDFSWNTAERSGFCTRVCNHVSARRGLIRDHVRSCASVCGAVMLRASVGSSRKAHSNWCEGWLWKEGRAGRQEGQEGWRERCYLLLEVLFDGFQVALEPRHGALLVERTHRLQSERVHDIVHALGLAPGSISETDTAPEHKLRECQTLHGSDVGGVSYLIIDPFVLAAFLCGVGAGVYLQRIFDYALGLDF